MYLFVMKKAEYKGILLVDLKQDNIVVLTMSKIWITGSGDLVLISDMSAKHLENIFKRKDLNKRSNYYYCVALYLARKFYYV